MKRYKNKAIVMILVCIMVYILMSVHVSEQTHRAHTNTDIINIPLKIEHQLFPLVNKYSFPQKLFEYAARLNNSKLKDCVVQKREVTAFNREDNETYTYRYMVPEWQLRSRKKPYFLTAVLRVRFYKEDKAKWTLAELKQWIHYQLWAGAEHIYICNHFLKPDERIVDELTKYTKAGLVTVIDWNKIEAVPGSKDYQRQNAANQIECYNHVLKQWGHMSTWMYNFDMDENPYSPQDHCEGFLTRFLQNQTSQLRKDTGLILLQNFILMGQGDRSRNIHYDRINRITPRPPNGNVKSLFRTRWTREAGMHSVKLLHGTTFNSPPSWLKMLHYWGARTQNWGPDSEVMLRSTEEFNDVRDTLAIAVRHSLLAFGEFNAFNNTTGP